MKGFVHKTRLIIFFVIATGVSCQKELNFDTGAASGTLKDPSGICFPQNISGTFYNGITPGNDTAYVEITVNVFEPGDYKIFTDTQNGLRFADSGSFPNRGITTIRLRSNGAPVDHIPTNFMIRFDTSACPLTINVADSALLEPVAIIPPDWTFTDTRREITYSGFLTNNYILELGSYHILVLSSKDAVLPGDSTFLININLPNGIIATGTYSTDDPPNGIVFKTFSDPCLNCAGGGLIPISTGATTVMKITDYNPVARIVKGTFSGTTINFFNEVTDIAGSFNAVMN